MNKIFDINTGKEYIETNRPSKIMLLSPEGILYRGDLEKYEKATCYLEESPHISFIAKYLKNYEDINEIKKYGINIENKEEINEYDHINLEKVYKGLCIKGYIIYLNTYNYYKTKDGYKSVLELNEYLEKNYKKYKMEELELMRNSIKKIINNTLHFGVFTNSNFVPTPEQLEMISIMEESIGEEIKTGFYSSNIDNMEDDELDISLKEIFDRFKRNKKSK